MRYIRCSVRSGNGTVFCDNIDSKTGQTKQGQEHLTSNGERTVWNGINKLLIFYINLLCRTVNKIRTYYFACDDEVACYIRQTESCDGPYICGTARIRRTVPCGQRVANHRATRSHFSQEVTNPGPERQQPFSAT